MRLPSQDFSYARYKDIFDRWMPGRGFYFYNYSTSLGEFLRNRLASQNAPQESAQENSPSTQTTCIDLDIPLNAFRPSIRIENDWGNVEIKRGHVSAVHVLICKHVQSESDLRHMRSDFDQVKAAFRIRIQKIASLVGALCHYQIIIPHTYQKTLDFTVHTDAGEINAQNIPGHFFSVSQSGRQTIDGVSEGANLNSESGLIIAKNIAGLLRATSESGDIIVHNSKRSLLKTESGNISLDDIILTNSAAIKK